MTTQKKSSKSNKKAPTKKAAAKPAVKASTLTPPALPVKPAQNEAVKITVAPVAKKKSWFRKILGL